MKKTISGLAAAAVLSLGALGGGAAVAAPGDYSPTKTSVEQTIDKVIKLIKTDNLTARKAEKLISKLKDAKDAGVIGKARFKKLKKKIKANI